MTVSELKNSVAHDTEQLPALGPLVQALWHDAKGDWHRAHELAQSVENKDGSWVHAYLHRKEGDESNASYWYARAGRRKPAVPLEQEWADIAADLLAR